MADDNSGDKTPLDVNALKNELKSEINNTVTNATSALLSTLQTEMRAQVEAKMSNLNPEPKGDQGKFIDSDLADEVEALGLDASQTKAMKNLIAKVAKVDTSKIKEDVTKSVRSEISNETTKERIDAKILEMYPDMADKNSDLYKQAAFEYQNNLDEVTKKSPQATYHAVREAALKLKVSPTNLAAARAAAAANPTGGGAGTTSKVDKAADTEFAAVFGVKDMKAYEAALARARAKRENAH